MNDSIKIFNTIWDEIPRTYKKNSKNKNNKKEYNTEIILSMDLL